MTIRPSDRPLAITLATLDAADEYRTYRTECPADGGWVSAQAFSEQPSILGGLLDAAAVELRGSRDAAASLVAGRLVDGFVEPAAQALGLLGRTWPLTRARSRSDLFGPSARYPLPAPEDAAVVQTARRRPR